MLNLSDKDLDRLSQEAAQQYEPGDVGSKLWEKLEVRLDRDLGKVNLHPVQGIRQLRYFYVPISVVILGVGFYFFRLNHKAAKGMSSGSPPFVSVQPDAADQKTAPNSSSNPSGSDKQNSTLPSNTIRYPDAGGTSDGNADKVPARASGSGPAMTLRSTRAPDAGTTSAHSRAPDAGTTSAHSRPHEAGTTSATTYTRSRGSHPGTTSGRAPGSNTGGRSGRAGGKPGSAFATDATRNNGSAPRTAPPGTSSSPILATNTRKPRELDYSPVGGPVRVTQNASIDDSALRAFNPGSIRQPINRRGGLHINRSLIFGLHGAPDFASVSSVAGDKAGSTFGLTVDYQFAGHLYIGSGLLYSRKIFAAAPQDWHVPPGYYSRNNMGMGMTNRVQIIKGRFDMLEVPVNVRYDFSTGDNSLLFLSVGSSSYFFTSEDCGYYYTYFSQPQYKQLSYGSGPTLFSTINLSVGGEFGINNSLSVLIAPYLKIPSRNLGFGQVQLTSIGIDFALRFAPVISRKR